jgi:lauroyl/myristoyl acyltransferase
MYFPNPFKFKGMHPIRFASIRSGRRPDLAFWAFLLATLLWVLGWRRRVLAQNLRLAGLTPVAGAERESLGRFLPRVFDEVILRWFLLFNAARDLFSLLTASYPRPLIMAENATTQSAIREMRSGPSLFLAAHVHHFEAMGAFLVTQGVPLRGVARPMSRPWAQRWLIRLRERLGLPVIWSERPTHGKSENGPSEKRHGSSLWLRQAVRHVTTGGCLALLWDQRPPGNSSVTGAFFGKVVACDSLPALVMHRYGQNLPIYVGFMQPDGKVRLLCINPPQGSRDVAGNKKRVLENHAALQRVLVRYHRWLEAVTRKHTGYAYWLLHRRFGKIAE